MGTDFITMECSLVSRPDITAAELENLIRAAYDNGFVNTSLNPALAIFQVDGSKVLSSWENFFVENAKFFAVGSEFAVFDSNDCLYGYRVKDDGIVFLDGVVEWSELDTLTLEKPIDEVRKLCEGRDRVVRICNQPGEILEFPNLGAAIDACRDRRGVLLAEVDPDCEGWVVTLHWNTATLTAPRGVFLSPPEGKVSSDEGLGRELRGGDTEAREGLDSGEGGTAQE